MTFDSQYRQLPTPCQIRDCDYFARGHTKDGLSCDGGARSGLTLPLFIPRLSGHVVLRNCLSKLVRLVFDRGAWNVPVT